MHGEELEPHNEVKFTSTNASKSKNLTNTSNGLNRHMFIRIENLNIETKEWVVYLEDKERHGDAKGSTFEKQLRS